MGLDANGNYTPDFMAPNSYQMNNGVTNPAVSNINQWADSLAHYGQAGQPGGIPGDIAAPITNSPIATPGSADPSGGGGGSWLDIHPFLNQYSPKTGQMTQQGWGMPAIQGAQALMGGWMGMQQLHMAKKALAQNQHEFNLNWNAQKKTTNSSLADRQARRVAADPNAQSVNSYMNKWGVK